MTTEATDRRQAPANGVNGTGPGALRVPHRRPARPRSRRFVQRPPRYPSRRLSVLLLCLGVAMPLALLGVLAYAVGRTPPDDPRGPADSVLEAAGSQGTSLVLAFVLVAAATWALRRLRLEILARRPGNIFVPVFAEGNRLTDADPVRLTSLFRQRFASLNLQAPAPVPGTAPEGGFLEVLGQNTVDPRNLLGSMLGLARAANPGHAWVVHGTLVERDEAPRYGVAVQVVRRPNQAAPPDTVFDHSWERAVRRAADRATAQILPQTRRCTAPWASWRSFVMPPALVEAYEQALEHEGQRRYDQALSGYFDALEQDPMNIGLRLHVGQLQEKLGLYLDALATYEGMLSVEKPGDNELPRWLYKPAAQRERRRALLIGRYRRVVLLGGPPLGEQWRTSNSRSLWTERDSQRKDLRDRLRAPLATQLDRTAERTTRRTRAGSDDLSRVGRTPVLELLDEPPEVPPAPPLVAGRRWDSHLDELRELLVLRALDEVPEVRRCLRKARGLFNRKGIALTETGLALTEVCLEERWRWLAERLRAGKQEDPPRWIWGQAGFTSLDERIRKIAPRGRVQRWHEHYNAACAYALPLLVEARSSSDAYPDIRQLLAENAVRHLAYATACADSGYLATRRDWLLSEDPDLDGLRTHDRFKAFEAMYFPAGVPTPRRPRYVQRLEVAGYTVDLIVVTAQRFEREWHVRRKLTAAGQDVHALLDWWLDERRSWQLVGQVAWNHRRWSVRRDLLQAVDRLSLKYGGAPLDVRFRPVCAEAAAPRGQVPDDDAHPDLAERSEGRFRLLAERLAADGDVTAGDFAMEGLQRWIGCLRQYDGAGHVPPRPRLADLCDRHAAVWERLHEWVGGDVHRDGDAAEAFMREMDTLEAELADACRHAAR